MSKIPFRASLCVAALLLAQTAAAEVATFEFCGHATLSNPMATAGTPVLGRMSWDTSAVGSTTTPETTFYYAPDTGTFSFSVGAHSVTSSQTWVSVSNDTGSNFADMIDMAGYAPVIDGTLFHSAYFGLRLASGWTGTHVFKDTSLPSNLNIALFDGVGGNYFQMYSGILPNDLLLDVSLKWIRRVHAATPQESARDLCRPI